MALHENEPQIGHNEFGCSAANGHLHMIDHVEPGFGARIGTLSSAIAGPTSERMRPKQAIAVFLPKVREQLQ